MTSARVRRALATAMFDRGGLVTLAVLVAYVALARPYFVDGDNAEFATLGTIGGVAHPSGYPLYLLWLRATSWLPGATAAHTTAISTAILGAALVGVLHAACRAWGARPLAATAAVAMFAASPVVLRMHTEAEVFAMNGLIVATILWLAAARGPLRGAWRAVALAALAGLGLCDHSTCVLVAPLGVLGAIRGVRETRASAPRVIALALGAFALALSPYAYLAITRSNAMSWGRIDSLHAVVDHFLRVDYGGPGAFASRGNTVPITANLVALVRTLGRTWLWAPLALGLVTLGWRVARPRDGIEPRWGWAMLAASFVLAGPVLVARFNVPPVELGVYIVSRFHLLPALLLAIPVAVGLDAAGARITTRVPAGLAGSRATLSSLATLGFGALVAVALPWLAVVHSPAVEDAAENVLSTLPEHAVVMTASDIIYCGASYLQLVRGERPDVWMIDWAMVPLDWYRERMAAHGVTIGKGGGPASIRVARAILASGRPLLVDRWEANILETFPSYPYGILIRVLPERTRPPSVDEVFDMNKAAFEKFVLRATPPGPHDEFATAYYVEYAATWNLIGRALEAKGEHEKAAFALALVEQLTPRP